jgi:hypothetical protein
LADQGQLEFLREEPFQDFLHGFCREIVDIGYFGIDPAGPIRIRFLQH